MDQQIENLRLHRNGLGIPSKLPPVGVQREDIEQVAHSHPRRTAVRWRWTDDDIQWRLNLPFRMPIGNRNERPERRATRLTRKSQGHGKPAAKRASLRRAKLANEPARGASVRQSMGALRDQASPAPCQFEDDAIGGNDRLVRQSDRNDGFASGAGRRMVDERRGQSPDRAARLPLAQRRSLEGGSHGLHHTAFEYASFQDLFDNYARLRDIEIVPVVCLDHGITTSMYYADPDMNFVELQVDNFGDWSKSSECIKTSPEFANPIGVFIDPVAVHEAFRSGRSHSTPRGDDGGRIPPRSRARHRPAGAEGLSAGRGAGEDSRL